MYIGKMRSLLLGAVLLSVASVFADSNHQCYIRRRDEVLIKDNSGWFQCNNTQTSSDGAQLCCRKGDRCGDDSICHSDDVGRSGSAWYVGGCSDGTYEDPVCRRDCTSFRQTWIEWNNTQHAWDCCGDSHCNDDHAGEIFKAVSPAEWEPIPQRGDLDGDDSSDDDGNGIELSTAAKAGIGAGAGVAVIAIITLIAVCCIKRKRPATKKSNFGYKGKYAQLGSQHEMAPGPFAGSSAPRAVSPLPRQREFSPAPASRGVSPAREHLVTGYGDGPPRYIETQADPMLAAQRSNDDGA